MLAMKCVALQKVTKTSNTIIIHQKFTKIFTDVIDMQNSPRTPPQQIQTIRGQKRQQRDAEAGSSESSRAISKGSMCVITLLLNRHI